VYNYIIPILKSDKEAKKAADEVTALFLRKADEIRWHYCENSYYVFE
jgi:hypothetical protein